MKFRSAQLVLKTNDIELLRKKIELFAPTIEQPDTIDQIDIYKMDLRIQLPIQKGFYSEIETSITIDQNSKGIHINTESDVYKPLTLSLFFSLLLSTVLYFTHDFKAAIISFCVIFLLFFPKFIFNIKRDTNQFLSNTFLKKAK